MKKCVIYARVNHYTESQEMFAYEYKLAELRDYAIANDFNIASCFPELNEIEKTEKQDFNAMIELIAQGEANSILCWNFNSLTRKPNEIGKIIGLMQNNLLTNIQTIAPSILV